ncbi:family 43 glycosylhydrolase [Aeoliella sp. SH292]|uniref:family 43 glycosylhydrolase n=1 Tax=Aeoliella sp. SH292 TaxID=3454464 RepID=UPI003F9D5B48
MSSLCNIKKLAIMCLVFVVLIAGGLRLASTANGQEAEAARTQPPPGAVLPGVWADPHIAFFGDRCYLYPTTDGTEGWRSTSFHAWSSGNLVDWQDEGVILDLPRDLKWADIHAWAPAIATKDGKYYYYYSADKNIGVAVADKPEGPFKDPLGKPLVSAKDYSGMQCIDPMVFVDDDGQAYLYWGQGRCKAVPLADDMISFDPAEVRDITPPGYNEGPFVHRRDDVYYLSWSEFDTRDPRYSVAYGTSGSPLGPFTKAAGNPILKQKGAVKGAGHHSIGKLPNLDQWVIAYHRFRIPNGDGYNRETCLSPLRHNPDGTIAPVDVFEAVSAVDLKQAAAGATDSNAPREVIVEIDLKQRGKPISEDLFGIFFEDLNYAADGGLYAELVENRSFEYSAADRDGWHSLTAWSLKEREGGQGSAVVESNQSLHANNPSYAVISKRNPEGEVCLENGGFGGIAVEEGAKYVVRLFARQVASEGGPIEVRLESASGEVLASAKLDSITSGWQQYEAELVPKSPHADAKLVVAVRGRGRVAVDMVSLFPRDTFRGRENGLRKDIAQSISDLKPKFVRFPGGCLVHGDGIDNMYRWQDTIGPVHERKGQRNIWRYHQSVGLGYFEYFQFCEDIGAKPLPVVSAGVSCQNSGASKTGLWGQGQQAIPLDAMPEYIDEVLDLIEYANGSVDSEWGAKRAAAGHPEPFGLEYLGVGNEDHITPDFADRFRRIRDAIAEKHPEITLIGTVGPFSEGEDFEKGWELTRLLKLAMVDEHYYRTPDWFLQNLTRYDGYDRSESKVYLGEFAAHEPDRRSTLQAALAEAAYMTHLERNGDVVSMSSYAPLLGKVGSTQWDPNLIYFTNTEVHPTISYYVQQMFSANSGDEYLATESPLPMSVVRDSSTGDVVVKIVNNGPSSVPVAFKLAGTQTFQPIARCTTLTGAPLDANPKDAAAIVWPTESKLKCGATIEHRVPAYSLTVIRLTPR